jgi:hypothetical protein
MKKTFTSTLILLTLILSACGSSQTNPPNMQSMPGGGEMPEITKLVIGTLNLKDTDNAITPEQAQELLPLWQVYLSLLSSDTAAQEETDALVEQIGETMTPEQTQAIEAMQLSQEDMFTVMQENGLGMGGGNRPQTSDDSSSGSNSGGFAPPDGGGMPGGAPPDGGGMPAGGGMPGGTQSQGGDQSTEAQPAQSMSGGGVPTPLIQTVIDYLQEIAGS